MAYGELYRFVFDAANGPQVTISILKDGYGGSVKRRAIGGNAVLKRERNGFILGSSLSWQAECVEEDEFAELYTTDPVAYQVALYFNTRRVWVGYLTAELYSAPWRDAPYDVTLTASDNFFPLKDLTWTSVGDIAIDSLLAKLLKPCGLTLFNGENAGVTVIYHSALKSDRKFLHLINVNVDHLAGKSYYEVLNMTLESLHAVVYSLGASYVLSRETDISGLTSLDWLNFGSLADSGNELYSVGQLSMEISPAKKSLELTLDSGEPKECLPMIATSSWFLDSGATIGNDFGGQYIGFPGNSKKEAAYAQLTDTDLGLEGTYSQANYTLQVRATLFSGYYIFPVISISVSINVDGSDPVTLYLNDQGAWSTEYPISNTVLCAPILKPENSNDIVSLSFRLPQKADGTWPYIRLKMMRVMFVNAAKCVAHIYNASLRRSSGDLPEAMTTRIILDNNARGAADGVSLCFGSNGLFNNVIDASGFTSTAIPESKTFEDFMAIDNALSIALPRIRLSGVVAFRNPASWCLPLLIQTNHDNATNLKYVVEECSFNLISGEIDLSMLSLPAAALSYTELTTSDVYGQSSGGSGGSGSSSGSSSSSSSKGEKGDQGEKGEKGDQGEKGEKGDKGDDGVGIKSVTQTTTSTADGGENVVTVELTDGTSSQFKVRNGSKGSPGKDGNNGADGTDGAAAGFDTPTAEAEWTSGPTPTASVTASGPDTAKKFAFSFALPKASGVADYDARLQARPLLRMKRGTPNEQEPVNRIIVSHPLLTSTAYEVVLMRYRRYNKTKRGTDQYDNKLFIAKKGWFVALGDKKITDHVAFTVTGTSGKAAIEVSDLRDFIVKRFMTDSNHTQAELFGRTYEQWAAESNSDRGFGGLKKTRQRFGLAIRYVNPAFTALLDSSKTLGNTTMELSDAPRYLYSDVAPIDVRLFTKGENNLMSEIWIGLVY